MRWEVLKHTSHNDGFIDDIDEEEVCAEPCLDDNLFRATISNARRDGERRCVFCEGVNDVSVFMTDPTLRLQHR